MEEKIFYNALNLVLGTNYSKLNHFKEKFGSWKKAWETLNEKSISPEKEWQKLEKLKVSLILKDNPGYPSLLKEIPLAPLGIYCLGNLEGSFAPLAIVGTRKATTSGKELARNFAQVLAKASLKIVSGLALGIDAEGHKGALDVGGKTIAVLGNGLDSFYPRAHEKLAEEILSGGGAILSEYPLGSPALQNHFLERNRIISGLSRGILVIEAPERSGSLSTAHFALDQNRELFVIPGFPNHPNFKGSNQLIRIGAELVTQPEEILESLGLSSSPKSSREKIPASREEEKIIEVLEKITKPASIDKIIELTKLEPQTVNQAISFLILKEQVLETEDGYTINQ